MFISSSSLWEHYSFITLKNGGEHMIMNKSYAYWSTLLSVIGTILLIMTYVIAPHHPQSLLSIIILLLMTTSFISLILGFIASIIAIRKKEIGFKKYSGILLPTIILLYVILIPFFMGVVFIVNENF